MINSKQRIRIATFLLALVSVSALALACQMDKERNPAPMLAQFEVIDDDIAESLRGGIECCVNDFENCPPTGGSNCGFGGGTCVPQVMWPYAWVCTYSQADYLNITPNYKKANCNAANGPEGDRPLNQIKCGVIQMCELYCSWDAEEQAYACEFSAAGFEDKRTPTEPDPDKPNCGTSAKLNLPTKGLELAAAANGIGWNPFELR